jgi:hypothetical protein
VHHQATTRLKNNLKTSVIGQTESVSVPDINAIIQPLGFSGVESGAGSYITITAPNGKTEKEFPLNYSGKSQNQKVVNDIISWMQGNMKDQNLINAEASGTFEGGSGELD